MPQPKPEPAAPPLDGDVLDVVLEETGPPGMPPPPRFDGATEARLFARTCPYCRSTFVEGIGAVVCGECGTPHHRDCWRENGGCTTYGCREGPGPQRDPARGVTAPGARRTRSWRAMPLPGLGGKSWIPVRLGRRGDDVARTAEWAAVAAFSGGLGALHPLLCPLLALCVVGIRLGLLALRQMNEAGEQASNSRGGALLAVIAGVVWIVVAVINYCSILL